MLAENTGRTAVPPEDLGRAVGALHDEFGLSYPAIAARLGVPIGQLQAWRQGRGPTVRSDRRAPSRLRPPAPRIRPRDVHALLARVDAGDIDTAGLVAELRGWIGDWTPAPAPSTGTSEDSA